MLSVILFDPILFVIPCPVLVPNRTSSHEKLKAWKENTVRRALGKYSLLCSCKSQGLTP